MKLLLYCTKGKPYLIQGFARPYHITDTNNPFNYKWGLIDYKSQNALNGKIIGECDYEIEELFELPWDYGYITKSIYNCNENMDHAYEEIEKQCCLTRNEIKDYLGNEKIGYAIYIKNLHIYDRPRDLFYYTCVKGPRNMQYVYSAYDKNKNILISIQPQWLAKILNGVKTIEVRKKVLKEMIGNE